MKIKQGTILGLAGVAGSGKDLLFDSIKSNPLFGRVEKVSLAQELKSDIRSTILRRYDVDIFDCSREEKNLVRPMMVAHGTIMRKKTNGKYWIEKVSSEIEKLKSDKEITTICITDIRYDEYENDEVDWLIDDLRGYLVHLSKFSYESRIIKVHPAANSDESKNDPKLKARSDLEIRWQEAKTEESKLSMTKKVSKMIHDWVYMKADYNRSLNKKTQFNYFIEKSS